MHVQMFIKNPFFSSLTHVLYHLIDLSRLIMIDVMNDDLYIMDRQVYFINENKLIEYT
jgi:hypothetical protein